MAVTPAATGCLECSEGGSGLFASYDPARFVGVTCAECAGHASPASHALVGSSRAREPRFTVEVRLAPLASPAPAAVAPTAIDVALHPVLAMVRAWIHDAGARHGVARVAPAVRVVRAGRGTSTPDSRGGGEETSKAPASVRAWLGTASGSTIPHPIVVTSTLARLARSRRRVARVDVTQGA